MVMFVTNVMPKNTIQERIVQFLFLNPEKTINSSNKKTKYLNSLKSSIINQIIKRNREEVNLSLNLSVLLFDIK